ncbi:formate dehydrogenase subunit alpha [soil metagenome]
MITAKINGSFFDFPEGTTILNAAQTAGIDIPTLCDDPRLKPVGACRLCLVEIDGKSKPVVSCTTIIEAGMEIKTDTGPVRAARKMNLRMLARHYSAEAFEMFPDKPFHKLSREYGLDRDDFTGRPDPELVDDSHPYIMVDMSRCIDCYRCIRICDEVQGQFVWQKIDRGTKTHIVPNSFSTLAASTCVSCGACVDTCPTGALEDKSVITTGFPTEWTKTVCPYCGTGCEMNVGVRNGRVVKVEPALEAPVSKGHLCVKGRYAFGFVHAADRVTKPMIRQDGEWKEVSWDDALAFTAARLNKIIESDGKEAIGVLGSARATNEEGYVAQKFARVVLGTNNVDCCARVCHTPSAAAMKLMLGTGAATNSFDEIEQTKTILICGANPTENHPIVGERMKQAVINNGTKLIIIDPRKTELTKYADVHLQLRAGSNMLLFNALAFTIIEEELADGSFIDARVLEYNEFREFVKDYSPESVAERCGLDAELIRKAARLYATSKPAMCFHGLGMTEHLQGTEGVMSIINLALLTGNIGKPGSGVNPLRGQNNVQGAAQMGCDPGILTGSIAIEAGREHFESVWKAPVPTARGLSMIQMIDAARDGKLKALWAIGYDVFLSNANAHETKKSMSNIDLVIIQDMFMNETAREFGHVFFPAASSFEKDGTFMNAERRVQRVRKAIEPIGDSRTDWEIVCDLARVMGKGEFFDYNSAEDIWNEIRRVWPGASGISYERIKLNGIQWPCISDDDPGTTILHSESFNVGKQAALRRIKYRPTPEILSEEFPFLLTTGRSLYQFNAATMSARTKNIELRPSDLLQINPIDAEELGLKDGQNVKLQSRYGEAVMPVEISKIVKKGEVFSTFHTASIFVNNITSPVRDRIVHAPEYKVTAVRLVKPDEHENGI